MICCPQSRPPSPDSYLYFYRDEFGYLFSSSSHGRSSLSTHPLDAVFLPSVRVRMCLSQREREEGVCVCVGGYFLSKDPISWAPPPLPLPLSNPNNHRALGIFLRYTFIRETGRCALDAHESVFGAILRRHLGYPPTSPRDEPPVEVRNSLRGLFRMELEVKAKERPSLLTC